MHLDRNSTGSWVILMAESLEIGFVEHDPVVLVENKEATILL